MLGQTMYRILLSTPILFLLALLVIVTSIHADIGNKSWLWFQRSGSVVVFFGALLSYRSIVRLGESGVGGAPVYFAKATVISTDDSGPEQTMKVAYDAETEEQFTQHNLDKFAGYIGSWLMVTGTLIWGYGDLLGVVL
jgi:hypothetical protein